MADLLQYTLPSVPHVHSGRGVRYRVLKGKERDSILYTTAILADGDQSKHTILRWHEGVCRMLVSCTEKTGLTDEQVCDPATKWKELTAQTLADRDVYDDLFTTADDEILTALYRHFHEPSRADIQGILGKPKVVSTG